MSKSMLICIIPSHTRKMWSSFFGYLTATVKTSRRHDIQRWLNLFSSPFHCIMDFFNNLRHGNFSRKRTTSCSPSLYHPHWSFLLSVGCSGLSSSMPSSGLEPFCSSSFNSRPLFSFFDFWKSSLRLNSRMMFSQGRNMLHISIYVCM